MRLKALAAAGLFLLLAAAGLLLFMGSASRRARGAAERLAEEFAPGRASRAFLARARDLGADEFVIEADGGRSALELRRADFARRWPAFEDGYGKLSAGAAQARFTGAPPFERRYCRIEFKGGEVTSWRAFVLD